MSGQLQTLAFSLLSEKHTVPIAIKIPYLLYWHCTRNCIMWLANRRSAFCLLVL